MSQDDVRDFLNKALIIVDVLKDFFSDFCPLYLMYSIEFFIFIFTRTKCLVVELSRNLAPSHVMKDNSRENDLSLTSFGIY